MRSLLLFCASAAFIQYAGFAQEPAAAYQELHYGLAEASPAKRIAAVLSLSVAKPTPDPVKLVEGMLADKDSGTRAAACGTLGEMKARITIPKLREALNDKAPEVIFAAAKALYLLGDQQGRAVLIAVLEGDQADKSGLVSSTMRDARVKLHEPKSLLLLGVNQGAGILGPFGAGVPIAEMLMKDNQASGRTSAALLLATDHSPEVKEAIKVGMGDKNWTVRVAVVRSAALLELTGLYDDVAALLQDKREEVRYAAAGAMIRLKQDRSPRPATRKK